MSPQLILFLGMQNNISYPSCDWCKCEITNYVYSIPLDKDWHQISGVYCSKVHALKDNVYFNRDNRPVENWQERERWFNEKEGGGGGEGEENLKKNKGF